MTSERATLSEFLELYKDLPCLWDLSSDDYRDKNKKTQAWELLADKLKVLEPAADIKDAKKRIEHMRTAYKREAKKVKDSKRRGSGASHVHVPNLWYYNLLTFVKSKDEQCRTGVNTLASDKESQNSEQASEESHKKKTRYNYRTLEKRKEKLIETAQELLQQSKSQPSNSFGIYISEQLEQVNTFQRQVAEKLIAEVLFLAKTGNLNFHSKIESPSRSYSYPSSSSRRQSSSSRSPSQFFESYSPQYKETLSQPQFILPCTTPQDIQSPHFLYRYAPVQAMQPPPSSRTIKPSPSPTFIQAYFTSPHRPPSPQVTQSSCSPQITQEYDLTPCVSSFQTIQTTISSPPTTEVYQCSSPTDYNNTILQASYLCHHPSSSPNIIQTSHTTQIQHNMNSSPSTEVVEPPIPSPTDQTSTTVHKASILKEYLIIKKLK